MHSRGLKPEQCLQMSLAHKMRSQNTNVLHVATMLHITANEPKMHAYLGNSREARLLNNGRLLSQAGFIEWREALFSHGWLRHTDIWDILLDAWKIRKSGRP